MRMNFFLIDAVFSLGFQWDFMSLYGMVLRIEVAGY